MVSVYTIKVDMFTKIKILSVIIALLSYCYADESTFDSSQSKDQTKNPEIEKIDARLAELALIWRQDVAIINRLTNFKRTPVQEGTQAYYQCMESSKRIQQAEAEAKELKEQKASILDEGRDNETGELNSAQQQNQALDKHGVSLKYKIRDFDAESVKKKGDLLKSKTPVFKGFYLGMPGEDALGLINFYMELPQADTEKVKIELFNSVNPLSDSANKYPYRIVKNYNYDKTLAILRRDSYSVESGAFAILDKEQNVVEFSINAHVRDIFFDVDKMPIDEFMKMFSDSYGIDFEPEEMIPEVKMSSIGDMVQTTKIYTHRDLKRGFEIKFSDGDATIKLKKIATENESKSKFD